MGACGEKDYYYDYLFIDYQLQRNPFEHRDMEEAREKNSVGGYEEQGGGKQRREEVEETRGPTSEAQHVQRPARLIVQTLSEKKNLKR